ncbi:unnamed protein product, partial [Rotaria magnacalcarata]
SRYNISASAQRGRCPHPQYPSRGLSCSTEDDDSICPWNYTCRPLTNVDQSPCTVCKCAADLCLTTTCHLGTKCTTQKYQPCAIKGRCGVTTKCIIDPSIPIDSNSKPKKVSRLLTRDG